MIAVADDVASAVVRDIKELEYYGDEAIEVVSCTKTQNVWNILESMKT